MKNEPTIYELLEQIIDMLNKQKKSLIKLQKKLDEIAEKSKHDKLKKYNNLIG